MSHIRTGIAVGVLAIIGFAGVGRAAEEADETTQQQLPDIVVTATRTEHSAYDVPASIDSVPVDDADTLGVNPSEFLDGIPGVFARDRQNYAQDEQISIRGFGARSTFGVRGVRLYIGGMSGGGRIASMAITKFPQLFDGALYIVGADDFGKAEPARLAAIAANRYVFLTGEKDFNRREMTHVHERYRKAGVSQTLLLDLPRFAHQYPDATDFESALVFLDSSAER